MFPTKEKCQQAGYSWNKGDLLKKTSLGWALRMGLGAGSGLDVTVKSTSYFMSEFERRRNTPQYWCNKSSDLRAAAGAIWYCMRKENEKKVVEELELGDGFSMAIAAFPVFPMLCGLSLELMYKAVCIAKNINFNKEHNLPNLCKLAKVPTTDEEYQFLALFTESVIWKGKYPVPTEKRKHALEDFNNLCYTLLYEKVEGVKGLELKRPNGRLSWETFNILWDKAYKAFYDARNMFPSIGNN